MGKCATLRVLGGEEGHDAGVRVVITSGTGTHFAAELFDLAGYPPFGDPAPSVVICKSPAGFRATYGPHAGLLLSADAKGCAPPQFWCEEYRKSFSKTTLPLYPLDPDASLRLVVLVIPSPHHTS
jgi:microcystin degradation protein MlrC